MCRHEGPLRLQLSETLGREKSPWLAGWEDRANTKSEIPTQGKVAPEPNCFKAVGLTRGAEEEGRRAKANLSLKKGPSLWPNVSNKNPMWRKHGFQ